MLEGTKSKDTQEALPTPVGGEESYIPATTQEVVDYEPLKATGIAAGVYIVSFEPTYVDLCCHLAKGDYLGLTSILSPLVSRPQEQFALQLAITLLNEYVEVGNSPAAQALVGGIVIGLGGCD